MRLILTSLLLTLTTAASAITAGQVEVRVYNGTGFTSTYVTMSNGQVIGKTAGVPAAITPFDGVFSSLTSKPTTLSGYGITDAQAYDADLATWAGISPSANVQSFVAAANYAAMRSLMGLGSMAVQNDSAVAISGGSVTNLTTFSILNSGSGAHDFQINHVGTMTGSHTLTYNLNDADRAISLSGNLTVSANATLSGTNTGDGLIIGTTTISGASSGDILTSNGTALQKITPGAGVSTALGNAVDASGGLLTYGLIGTSGTKIPLLDAANTWSAAQTIHTGSSGDAIARFESAAGNGITIRTVSAGDFGGAYVGNPLLAFDYDNFFIKGGLLQPSYGASISMYQVNLVCGGGGFIYSIGGSAAVAGTHFRLGNDGTYQGNFVVHSGDNTTVLTITPAGALTAAGAITAEGGMTVGSTGTAHTKIKSGVATLVAGTVTISDSDVLETGTAATSSRIFVTRMTDGGTLGTGYSITRVNATSFTITSTSSAETSTLSWVIFNP